MNRLAIFTEGYTEIVFVKRLIEEIAGKNKVAIQHTVITGSGAQRKTRVIRATRLQPNQEYYILLVDCQGDEQVKSRIIEEQEKLTKAGYSRIIGIRDVRPQFTYEDIPRLEANLAKYIPTKLTPVTFILAIMELEAWFLAEASHYPRIEPSITLAAIKANLGFDPENDNMDQRLRPADDLIACYSIGGKTYRKGQVEITVNALDYTLIYTDLRNKIKYLDHLISLIDQFLS